MPVTNFQNIRQMFSDCTNMFSDVKLHVLQIVKGPNFIQYNQGW